MDIDKLTIEEMKKGYRYDLNTGEYICNFCGKSYFEKEIYRFDDRFYEASKAVAVHIDKEHDDIFDILVNKDTKYNTLTDNQKDLLRMMYANSTDKQIAAKLEISSSTVRHMRFMFREKAKQAKMYLAIYELVNEKYTSQQERIIPIHSEATMIDDRYVTTEKEKENIVKNSFSSIEPLVLKHFPVKEKKKIVVLAKISEQFENNRRYTEKEVNQVLKTNFDDYVTLRRYLIEYGFMERTTDCNEYWLK